MFDPTSAKFLFFCSQDCLIRGWTKLHPHNVVLPATGSACQLAVRLM